MLRRRVVGLRGLTRLLLFSLLSLIAILPTGWAQTPPTVSRVAKIMPIADPTRRRTYELVLNSANFAHTGGSENSNRNRMLNQYAADSTMTSSANCKPLVRYRGIGEL